MSAQPTRHRPRPLARTVDKAKKLARYGWSASRAGEHTAALTSLRLASEALPDDHEIAVAYGLALARAGQERAARDALRAATLHQQAPAEVWCALAEVALALNDHRTALSSLRVCVRLDPDAATPAGVRARVLAMRAAKGLRRH